MATKARGKEIGERLLGAFLRAGAVEVTPDFLQPAETLLDLYGEDIRARAYVTSDPLRGEMMMRPDFTVPVVEAHMANGAEPARYCYMGEVFRRQDHRRNARANEYLQAGYEVFDRTDPEAADAEVFALFARLLAHLRPEATIGDIGILRAAVEGIDTIAPRKAALLHHIWRPRRFHNLLTRYAGLTPVPAARQALLSGAAECDAPWVGLRSVEEMEARIAVLRSDADAQPISAETVAQFDALFALNCAAHDAPERLRALGLPGLDAAIKRLQRRLDALAARSIDTSTLWFEASHGRTTLEYYDGFVFTFSVGDAPLSSGGRYDALTRVLGGGNEIPAVGGIIRPAVMAELEDRA